MFEMHQKRAWLFWDGMHHASGGCNQVAARGPVPAPPDTAQIMPVIPLWDCGEDARPVLTVNQAAGLQIERVLPMRSGIAVRLSFTNFHFVRGLLFQVRQIHNNHPRVLYQETLTRRDLNLLTRNMLENGGLAHVGEPMPCPFGSHCGRPVSVETGEELAHTRDDLEVRVVTSPEPAVTAYRFPGGRVSGRQIPGRRVSGSGDFPPGDEAHYRLQGMRFRHWIVPAGDPSRVRDALETAAADGAPFTGAIVRLCRPVFEGKE
jgi:hypothetical protein